LLFDYIQEYFYSFPRVAKGASSIKAFEMELVKCCKYMLKFGIFTNRNDTFQIDDVDDLFSFLCHILDIFTNRKEYIGLSSLDTLVHKDSIIADYTQNNPVQKAFFDIKYSLLNKKDWTNSSNAFNEKSTFSSREQNIHSKIILEIMEVFHFLLDLRQTFLMSNIVEMFHKRVFKKQNKFNLENITEKDKIKATRTMIKDFKKVLPESAEFKNYMSFSFPSVDEMYDNKEFENYRELVQKKDPNLDMHDEFLILIIDTFNVSTTDKLLQQNALNLICRYYSERSELIRNIERMLLLFNEEEWMFFQWVNKTIDEFTRMTEKSTMWLNNLEEFDEEQFIDNVNDVLQDLRSCAYYKFTLKYDNENDDNIIFEKIKGERKINKFAQKVFRSIKIYDHLINFITQNIELFTYVRTVDNDTLSEEQATKVDKIEKVFILKYLIEGR
jgi:hypothetical protein